MPKWSKGFESLKNLSPNKKGLNQDAVSQVAEVANGGIVGQRQSNKLNPETELNSTDQVLFTNIISSLGIQARGPDGNRYWRIRDLIRDSHRHDVSFEVNRWITHGNLSESLQAPVQTILNRGYEMEARVWLRASLPKGMQSGHGNRSLRIEKAMEFSRKAGIDIVKLASEEGADLSM